MPQSAIPRAPRSALVLACVLGGLLAPGAARAQAPANEARALAVQAEADAQAGRYDAAIRAYERAYDLSPDPAYLYNLGVLVLLGRDDPEAAWGFASRYADAVKSEEGKRDAEALLKRIEEPLARTHGRLTLSVTPSGADVYLDRVTTAGRLRRTEVWVRAGAHRILAEAPGFEAGDIPVDVRAGSRAEVRLDLRPREARLRIESRTPGVDLTLDGAALGAPPVERRVSAGVRHVLRATAPGHKPLEQVLQPGPGEEIVVRADPSPLSGLAGTGTGPMTAPPPAPYRKGLGRDLGWGLMGSGLGLGAVATVLYGVSWSRQQKGKDPFPMGYWAYALWGVGGAMLISGIVIYVELDDKRAVSLVPTGPGGPGLTAMVPW